MISDEEMEQAIHQIADYCRRHEGGSGVVIGRLLEDLNEYISLRARDEANQSTRDAFVNAVSTLILIASPPGRDQFESTLASISQLTDSAILTVAFDPDPHTDDRDPLTSHSIEVDLPPPRQLNDAEVATIEHFRRLLSEDFNDRRNEGEST